MKTFILPVIALFLSFNLLAQTYYSEDFEGVTPPSLPTNATSTDYDGDGYGWETSTGWAAYPPYTNSGNIAHSRSWSGTAGALSPNNFLVLGPINLTSASGVVTLFWETGTIQTSPYHAEQYSVYVTTSNSVSTILASTALHNETFAAGGVMYNRNIDVSSYAGSQVYVTFRHHDTFDMNMIGLDNVKVQTVEPNDAGVSDITTWPTPPNAIDLLSNGSQIFTGEITNFGSNTITSLDLNYSIDGGATYTQNLAGLSLPAGGTYNFSHSNSWTPSATGCYDLDVWTSNVNGSTDPNPTNDNYSKIFRIVNQAISTLPLYENFTSNTCGPCASFNPGFQSFINSNNVNDPANASVANIKYQMDWPGAADQSWNSDGDTRRGYYAVGGIPDHYIDGESGSYSQSEVNTHTSRYAGMAIDATTTTSGNTITVDVTIDPIACYGANTTLHIAVTEDSYTNTAGNNGESQFHQVMRKMLPDANGTTIGPLTEGVQVSFSETYTFTVGSVSAGSFNLWNGLNNTTVIVFVQDDDSKQVLQTAVAVAGCGAAAPTVNSTTVDATCSGLADGSINITVTGGTTPYTYSWSNGATTADISSLVAGAYIVVITDGAGCVTTQTITVNDGASVTLSTTATDANCSANDGTATATPTGGASPYNYQWDAAAANQTNQTATGLAAGTYSVTATDANGCTSSGTVTVGVNNGGVTVSTTATDANCGANDGTATATATGGSSPYNYQWDAAAANQTTQTATALAAGTYSVTVTDANGCSSVGSVTVSSGGAGPTLVPTTTDVLCNGGTDGIALVSPSGGTAPYTYLWSNGNTTQIANGLAASTYMVTVTDANGCSSTSSVVITEPSLITTSTSSTEPGCGASDGTATVTATGGITPYAYAWSDGQTTATATGLAAGSYTVDVTDANGCTVTEQVNLSNAGAGTLVSSATDVTCNGYSDGSITTTFTGGTGTINYAWSTGVTASSLAGLTAGTYTVTVTDDNNCVVTESIVVNEPDAIVIAMAYQNVSTPTSCDGTATGTPTGGTSPYAYLWDDLQLQTTQTAVGLCVGTYSVMITDANGCVSTSSVMVDSIAMDISNAVISGSMNVFPNPTTGAFTIEVDHPFTSAGVLQILGIDGKLVFQEEITIYPGYVQTIELDNQVKGIYFIRIIADKVVLDEKVVIQ